MKRRALWLLLFLVTVFCFPAQWIHAGSVTISPGAAPAPGPSGAPGPNATPTLPVGTLLDDPTISGPIATGIAPASHAGDFEIGNLIIVTQPGIVSTGARVGWVSTAGSFHVRLWRYSSGTVIASALNIPAPASTGIVQVTWSTPVALNQGEWYVVSYHDVNNTTYVTSTGSESITDGHYTHVGIYYPSGVSRHWYATGHAPTMPSLDDGTVSLQSLVVAGISQVTNIVSGATGVSIYTPIEWASVPGATGYYVQVGTTPGGSDVWSSGLLVATGRLRRHIAGLATSTTYHVTISTVLGGVSFSNADIAFATKSTDEGWYANTNWPRVYGLVDRARQSADINNNPFGGSILDDIVGQAGGTVATCYQYSAALVEELLTARVRGVAFLAIALQNNGVDAHEEVTVRDASQGLDVLLDPTFDLVPFKAGLPATAAQVHTATAALNWTAITYRYLGSFGPAIVQGYYIDWPQLFWLVPNTATWADPVRLLSASRGTSTVAPTTITPHTPSGGDFYVQAGATPSTTGTVTVSGNPTITTTIDAHGYSQIFLVASGATATITAGGGALYELTRKVF